MKINGKKITHLSDDIRQIVNKTYSENLEMVRLCKDHHNPFLHDDEKPILDITQDEFVGIFDLNSDHYFLSPIQVLRLGEFCRLPLPSIIALMLKAEWEGFLSERSGYFIGAGLKLRSILNDQRLIRLYISDFKPNKKEFFNLIRNTKNCSNIPITNSHLYYIIDDLLKGNDFLMGNERISQLYPERNINEKMLLNEISKSEQEAYFHLKELWKEKSTELDDLLFHLERKKRLNMGIENKYMKTFGKTEIEKSELKYKVEKYRIILEAMQENPELSYRELVKLAIDKLTAAEKERNNLKNIMARSFNCAEDVNTEDSSLVTKEFKNSYMEACKKLLRKLFFLLHSDTCPEYSELSKQKKIEINNLWLKLMKSTKQELYSFSPSMLLYSLPDYQQLEAIYIKACEILEINPEDFEIGNRLEFMIRKGTPIAKIMEFLKNETEGLELHLAHLELIQNEYTHEDQTQLYRDALANISAHSERLKIETSDLKKNIIKLKKKISNRFMEIVK